MILPALPGLGLDLSEALAQRSGVMTQMVIDEAGNEVVAVVIPRLQAQFQGMTSNARRLGLVRKTLHDRIRRLGLDADAYRGS